MIISDRVQQLQSIVDPKDSRVSLRGVYFDEKRLAVVTNGSGLVARQLDEEESKEAPIGEIHAFSAAKFKGAASKLSALQYTKMGENGYVAETAPENYTTRIDAQYPEWRRILPTKEAARTITIALDATLLAKLANCLSDGDHKDTKRRAVWLEIDIDDPSKPIAVMGTRKEAFGLIMPCKTDDTISPIAHIGTIVD